MVKDVPRDHYEITRETCTLMFPQDPSGEMYVLMDLQTLAWNPTERKYISSQETLPLALRFQDYEEGVAFFRSLLERLENTPSETGLWENQDG